MSDIALLPEVRSFIQRQHGHYINGQAVLGNGANSFSVINPATEQVIATVNGATLVKLMRRCRQHQLHFKAYGHKLHPWNVANA